MFVFSMENQKNKKKLFSLTLRNDPTPFEIIAIHICNPYVFRIISRVAGAHVAARAGGNAVSVRATAGVVGNAVVDGCEHKQNMRDRQVIDKPSQRDSAARRKACPPSPNPPASMTYAGIACHRRCSQPCTCM